MALDRVAILVLAAALLTGCGAQAARNEPSSELSADLERIEHEGDEGVYLARRVVRGAPARPDPDRGAGTWGSRTTPASRTGSILRL